MAKFEVVSRFAGEEDLLLPTRGTENSAGYDFIVAEDVIIPSWAQLYSKLMNNCADPAASRTLSEMASATKLHNAKPTLVSSGVKCKLEPDTYLELSVRSSTPLKHWLILANSVGVIDADYYNNPDNEGEIFFQMINLSPFPIRLQKGDRIGQGIIKPFLITEDDAASGTRLGGFGSTGTSYIIPTSSIC